MGIFFNQDNLILALPLLSVCAIYAFFKYIPLQYGVPAVIGVGIFLQLRAKVLARRAEKALTEIDESLVNDLTADEDKVKAKVAAKAAKQQLKAQEKVRQRLNAERKGTGRAAEGENEEGDENISTFAKGGRGKQKKK
uniref:Uncharacterized protein n=1 Tax=Odontella aurita TaxID=265563 RepID=A0A7S4MHX0_9STRA|mmetsp:Transcript_22382/g.66353  ORF Transcript_22382/g.66353 Transcript_22382/m.66353 type:complete len:138 (+) Transcript_22382:324-737(+)|eukprot:CAMPEP_0113564308 /NCGR_PEP_ID=MMETSP0015_2-20120614/21553_1 /TAXON_ID=2838 /ORGANISM="Odontella" /LENGTH=137 /DNA_ID=CAMNT_0000466387 /DNA_START=310 /DNA_END=723 /DNA_ORIENTATION=+ /assembly_acc=CAM_ASM_000160